MKLTSFSHSGLLLDTGSARIVVDPGTLTAGWEDTRDVDAICVTHAHPDHIDWERLPMLVDNNPDAALFFEAEVASSESAQAFSPTAVHAGDTFTIGDVNVEAVGGQHATIHADIPVIGNVGLVFRTDRRSLFHPGDSLMATPDDVDILAVPVNAPWCAMKETVDFVRDVAPRTMVPIHDGLLSTAGRGLYVTQVSNLSGSGSKALPVSDIEPGSTVVF